MFDKRKVKLAIKGGVVQKERVYIEDPSEAPEDVNVEEGERGGYYYETGSSADLTEDVLDAIEEGFEEGMSAEEISDTLMETEDEPSGIIESLVDGFGNVLEEIGVEITRGDKLPGFGLEKSDKVYVSDPSEAPDYAMVHDGPRGGYYYFPEPEIVNLDPERDLDQVMLEVVNQYVNTYGVDGLDDLDYWATEISNQVEEGEMENPVDGEFESLSIGDSGQDREGADTVNSILTTFGLEGLDRLNYWTNQIQERRSDRDD